jgi:hypothetical protein
MYVGKGTGANYMNLCFGHKWVQTYFVEARFTDLKVDKTTQCRILENDKLPNVTLQKQHLSALHTYICK